MPTLVLAKTGDLDFPIEQVRAMAAEIAGARFEEFPGDEHFFWVGPYDDMLGSIERFVGGLSSQESELRRSLATVVFTDIVGSTATAAVARRSPYGRSSWRTHHRRVRGQLARFEGAEVDTAGDGFLATFDGPARAVRCATSIAGSIAELGLEVRAGVHTGEVEHDRRQGRRDRGRRSAPASAPWPDRRRSSCRRP